MTQDIKPIGSPFHISDTPSRVNTLRTLYGSRGQMSTTIKPEPAFKKAHWLDNPGLKKQMYNAIQSEIDAHQLVRAQGVEWTPETFLTEYGIDTSAEFSIVRKAAYDAVKNAYIDDLTLILTENGVTDPTEQALAFKPYDSLDEAINSTGVNLKSIRMQVCGFATSHFLKAADASTHKEQPTMTPAEKAALEAIPFDAPDDKPEDLGAWFPRDNETINPDANNAPNVNTVKPLPETVKPLNDAQINALKERLLQRVATTFPNETDKQHKDRLRTALEAETFADFLYNNRTAKNVAETGDTMVDAYIMAHGIQKGIQAPPSPAVAHSEPAPTKQDVIAEQPAPQLALVPQRHSESPVTCYPSPRGEVVYNGVRYDVSFREGAKAETALELLNEWDRFWKLGAQQGVQRADVQQPIAPATMQTPQPQPATPVQSVADGGEVTCVMISVGTSFEAAKPQLEFMIDGDDHPMRYTQPVEKMVQLLANVRKMDGTPFTIADLTTGRKFPGVWKIAYRPTEKNGKNYKNVVAVKSAA